ncbi:MAG: hypothetical protein ACTH5M_03725 [Psychrobacter sp.]
MAGHEKIKKRLLLGAVAMVLLVVPRRSSQKADIEKSNNPKAKK